MSFKDIRGQDGAILLLKNAVETGKFANAYIFYGPDGVGKKLAALNFAKAANCAVRNAGEGCDNCPSCKKIDSLNHPDVHLVTPDKDGASVKIDDIRAVIKDEGLKPYEANRKFYIIDEANKLTEEAANALLKTLEEPSPDATLILITESLSRLFPTIRSRCQVVKFFLLSTAVVEEILAESHETDRVKAHVLASLACGRLSEALRLNDEDLFEKRSRIITALSSGSLSDLDLDKKSKTELRILLDIMLAWYRDILVTKAGDKGIVNIDKTDIISSEAKKMGFEKLDNIIKRIISTEVYLDQNVNQKLAMAALALSI